MAPERVDGVEAPGGEAGEEAQAEVELVAVGLLDPPSQPDRADAVDDAVAGLPGGRVVDDVVAAASERAARPGTNRSAPRRTSGQQNAWVRAMRTAAQRRPIQLPPWRG